MDGGEVDVVRGPLEEPQRVGPGGVFPPQPVGDEHPHHALAPRFRIDRQHRVEVAVHRRGVVLARGDREEIVDHPHEDRLRAHPLVSQCIVLGDNQPFIAALITIDQDMLKGWVATNKKEGASMQDLANDPDLITVIQTAVDEANKAVSKAESIRKFTILPTDFTIAGGHLTAKLSLKRHVINQEFASQIAQLFAK